MDKDALYLSIADKRAEIKNIQLEIVLSIFRPEPSLAEIREGVQKLQQIHHDLRPLLLAFEGCSIAMEEYDELLFKLDLEALLFSNNLTLCSPK